MATPVTASDAGIALPHPMGGPRRAYLRGPDVSLAAGEPPRILISELCCYLEAYLPQKQVKEVYRAYLFGAEAHEGQQRQSGEPYIYHPIAVTRILAEMRMDYKCLMAALLHDVIEDTQTAKDQLAAEFDQEIADLVDGVSKLSQIDFKSRAEAQAASLRKMLLAVTRDIRVILIKLADRLHNMRTLGAVSRDKARRIARETLEIYAPIANRLGISTVRIELEELSFAHYWPWRHRVLKRALRKVCGQRKEVVGTVQRALRRRLFQEDIEAEVLGRQKHLYGIYRKMRSKRRSFSEVVDMFGFRVIVDRVDTCYRVLGLVHNLYKPVPGRFKDYIAIPKSNGYQSLHTVLFGPQGAPIEIQIRTRDMQRVAESGIAAHWIYKVVDDDFAAPQSLAADWLQNLLEVQRTSGDSVEFLEHVKVDLFPDEVYVFTPRGQILVLPKGACVVDFAYAIHSDVGNTCVAARIDRRLAPLRTALGSGQTVEIINAPGAAPNPAWLNFVVTGKARANIRGYLKNLQRQEAEALGRRLLDTELASAGARLDGLSPGRLDDYLAETKLADVNTLYAEIGLGNRLPVLVARYLISDRVRSSDSAEAATRHSPHQPLAITGTEGMVVAYARCCRPIPGDDIVGYFSPGKGIVIHRQGCRNLGDYEKHKDKWLDVEWARHPGGDFTTEIRVDVGNRRGALATVAAAIAEMGCNIDSVQSQDKDGISSSLSFLLSVHDRQHLARIIRRLRQIRLVMRIMRISR